MTETERTKNLINSFDVFEFKEEDELAAIKFAPKFGYSHPRAVSRTKIKSEEIDTGICGDADVDIGYNRVTAGSFTPFETEDLARETPALSHVLHNDFKSHEQDAGEKSEVIESGSVLAGLQCISGLGTPVRLEDNFNVAVPDSLRNILSVHLASDADENMSERSPFGVANDNASSDGSFSDDCASDCNMRDERVGIVFYADYVDYCGTHYLDSMVSFSRSFVEARSKTMFGNERTFQIHLEIDDIVKIESQWSARYEAGTISIYFISKDGVQDDIIHTASGLQELKFPAVDSDWYQKQEAIGSLDMRYKALWNVLLDTGTQKISPLPEGGAMMQTRTYFPKFDKPFEEVIYPKGDPDAVSISKRDVDLLLPDTFVNDTIIDFYIKYLKSRQNAEERAKFHFFNSFFFRKLADMDKDPSCVLDGKSAFQRVRKWTRKINLLEKDFIFIPVNYNYKDVEDGKSSRVPCILHMDSLRGTHVDLKDLLHSYLWEEWKERRKETPEGLGPDFRNMKFIPVELPQQQNSYDCGLFLLHYVELFLEEVPANFSIYKITSSSKFLQEDWFPPGEASMKRTRIERLINDLLDTQSEDCPPFGGSGMHCSPEGPKTTHGYGNGVECLVKSSPLSGCREISPRQVDQGVGMTLLPPLSTGTQCKRTASVSAPEPFNDAPWGVFGNGDSIHELKRPVHLTEAEVDANECSVQQELQEHVFQHLDSATLDNHVFPLSSGDFKSNPVREPSPEDIGSSPATSGSDFDDDIVEVEADDDKWQSVGAVVALNDEIECLPSEKTEHLTNSSASSPSAEKPICVEIDDPNGDGSFFIKGANEDLAVGPALGSGCKLDISGSIIAHDEAHRLSRGRELVLKPDEQRSAKRMRIVPPDAGEDDANNLSGNLHL
ncbi:hypothetical protein OROHE_001702 [Orobanche hederae]